jgi:PAS domain S-box-containing protein
MPSSEAPWQRSGKLKWKMERRGILWGFVAAASILVFVGLESYWYTVRVDRAADARKHSYEAQLAVDEVAGRLVDAETGQRGYLLTGDETYLEPYHEAIKGLDQAMEQVKALTAGNPNQQRLLQALEPLIEKELAELQVSIDLRRKEGFRTANQVVFAGQGKQWMDQIRGVLGQMKDEENNLRGIRTQEMRRVLTRTSYLVAVGDLLSSALFLLVFVFLLHELSERKRAQESLAKSEQWFSTTLASIGDAVIATDMGGAVTFMNPVAQSLTGWSLKDAQGKSMDLVFDIVNKETRRPVENPVKKVFREGKVVGLADHTLLLSKNGKEYEIEDSAAPILSDSWERFGVVLVFRDITEKNRAEEETKRQKELLQLILASVADGVVVADSKGKFLLFNAAAEQILGIGATEAAPDKWSEQYGVYLPDTVTPYPSDQLPLVRAMRGENVDAEELFIRNPQMPKGRLLNINGRPLKGEDGALKGGVVVFHDITERKRAEEALRQSEQRYRLLFDSNPHPVWVYDLQNLAILDVNNAAVRNYGYSREEFLSLTIKDIRPPGDIPALLQSAAKASPDTETAGGWRHRKKDGTLIDVEITSHPLVYGGKNARLVVATDITVRKQAEEALQTSEEKFRNLVHTANDAIITADEHGNIIDFNPGAEAIFAYSAGDVIGKPIGVLMPDRFKEPHQRGFKRYLETGEAHVIGKTVELTGKRRDGTEFPIELSLSGWKTRKGLFFTGILSDITERKNGEEALRQSEERFRLLVSEVADYAILMLDPEGGIVSWNAGAERIKGYRSEEIIGQHFSRFYPKEDAESGKPARGLKVAAEQGRFVDEGWRVRKDGSRFWANVVITALFDEAGRLRGFGKVTRDITEQKHTQELLMHAKEEAERASKFKDQFLSTMSHELRTPLNAVLGFSDLLADERYGPLNDRQQRYITHIHTGGKHLLKLISDILDLSKIEAGRMELSREDVTVASAFGEVISALYPLAEKKSQALLQQVESNLHVHADPMRLKQVLMNLAGNAIKFTPEGGRIELVARQLDNQVRIEVRDTGPGIPPELRQRIFEAFYRLAQTENAIEGTGLGLAITSRLVELHGSKLEIASELGEGTCFYFSLPLVAVVPDEPAQTSVPAPRARKAPRILVVEDNAMTGQLIQSQLTSSGYETVKCDQPELATDMAAELQPDAITLDLLMKPVHGLEVLLQLKNDPRTSKIPVIVVTIVDRPGLGTALGADEFLIKPVDKATLLAAVERCLRSRGGVAPPRTILVVEDEVSSLEIIVELLKSYGYAVTTATDSEQARASVAQSLPELVILDLILPKTSGFELLAEWRSNPRTVDLPVFVLTSKDLTKEEERYLHAHSESVFQKQDSWREALIKQLERVVTSTPLESA